MKYSLISVLVLMIVVACEGPEGPAGPSGNNGTNGTNGTNGVSSLVALADEPAGSNCSSGGIKITTGGDDNGNGTLDAGEIDNTQYVCGGGGSGSGPKELRFTLGVFGAGDEPSYNTLYEGFDYKNFEAYDSIVLVLKNIEVKNGGGTVVNDKEAIVEIVNGSNDNAVIAGSQFTIKTGDVVLSPNFAASLPAGNFDLGYTVKTVDADHNVIYRPTLVLIDRD